MQIYFGSKFSSNLLAHFMNNRAYALIFYTGVCVWKNAFDTLEYISSSPNIFLTNGHWINIFKSRVRAGVNRQCAGRDQEGSAVQCPTLRDQIARRAHQTRLDTLCRDLRVIMKVWGSICHDFVCPVQCQVSTPTIESYILIGKMIEKHRQSVYLFMTWAYSQ